MSATTAWFMSAEQGNIMTIEQDKDETPVIFRADRAGEFKGVVTAVFPTIPADSYGETFSCYGHIGQHSGATWDWYHTTRPAKPEEFADLKRELEAAPYGYRLKVYSKMQTEFHTARRAEARRSTRA